ncbi:hypothetical protein VPH35_027730 [Triticum aestivum]
MNAGGESLWESLSTDMKHEVATLATAWKSCHARRIEVGLPASSPKVLDDEDDLMMETSSNDTAPALAHVHAGFTMEHTQAHYNAAMAEVHHAPAPLLTFQQTEEE